MLPTINLTSADFTSLTDSASGTPGLPGAFTTPEGSFADLLRGPTTVAVGEPIGESLPETGNGLPLLDSQALLGRFPSGQPWPADLSPDEAMLTSSAPAEMPVAAAGDAVEEIAERAVIPALVAPADANQIRRPTQTPGAASILLDGEGDDGSTAEVTLRASNDAALRAATSGHERPRPNVPLPAAVEQRAVLLPATNGESATVLAAEPSVAQTVTSTLSAGASATGGLPFVAQAPFATVNQTTSGPVLETSLPLPVQDSAWSESLGERVVFMSGNRIQNAEIRLTPAELGPIRVNVSLDDGAANVTFSAQHATTREAIEAALPRLREMLAEQGLSLGNANVADQGPNPESEGSSAAEEHDSVGLGQDSGLDSSLSTEEHVLRRRVARGLVDTFV